MRIPRRVGCHFLGDLVYVVHGFATSKAGDG